MLRFTSCQAEVAESFCKALASYIGHRLGIATEFIGDIPWQEREQLLDEGQIDVAWICGLPYIRKSIGGKSIDLLAAPVMRHARYANKPVYYSDVVVHGESHFQSFEDLRGASWAYNERGSHSGYNLVRYHLAVTGAGPRYFGQIIESGSHQDSLRMMQNTPHGRRILENAGILRFVRIADGDYDPIREMERVAAGIEW